MILRAVTLMAGLAGAGVSSQFPEFSQQYAQRLGGAVDELATVIADFDATATASNLSRVEALEQMQGTDFLTRRRADMERTIDRHGNLSQALTALQNAGPFMRAYQLRHFTDRDIATRAYEAYQPAVPLTLEGGVFAGVGFLGGAGLLSALLGLLRLVFRRRSATPAG